MLRTMQLSGVRAGSPFRPVTLVLCGAALVLALATVALLHHGRSPTAKPVVLPDGTRVRLLAVTYGTNHVVGSPLARLATRLPASARTHLTRLLGPGALPVRTTSTPIPTLVIWLERLTNTTPPGGFCDALLADPRGFLSGEDPRMAAWPNPEQLRFRVFPRREAVCSLEFFYHDPTGGVRRCGSLPIANPVRGKFPRWQPEALPATKRVGDLEVTLEKVSTGHDNQVRYVNYVPTLGTNRVDGRNQTLCLLHPRSPFQTNALWLVVQEEVSDATGNQATHTSLNWGGPGDDRLAFEPGLWPNEAAWKIKLTLKRAKGFAPEELLTLSRVPLGAVATTTSPNATTHLGGLTVTVTQIVRRFPGAPCLVNFALSGLTNGLYVDLLSACTDSGTDLEIVSWGSGGVGQRYYQLRSLGEQARTADFTFAVQQARSVEFTVKPEVCGPMQANP